jgi:2-iminoacetate synthase ThiH
MTQKLSVLPEKISVEAILNQALTGKDLTPDQALLLLLQKDYSTIATIEATADELRRRQAGSTVTYVINRNINFTNICRIVVFVPFVAMSAIEILFG